MVRKILSLTFLALLSANLCWSQQTSQVQSKANISLFNQIAAADSTLFHAVNTCDSVTYIKFFNPDVEFYHDLGGLTVGSDNELKSFKEMCARGSHIRRELIKGSLEVYPIRGYGAIEIATHRFYHTNKGQQEKLSGTYKFLHVWQFKDNQWKLARIISYGHEEMHND
ncbi:nuclear transport factor 2 family protein [Pedobacter sp. PAMC26386]|nr:nuclear transport factor 2 family protein [Pedobacter sp. PAMC26386]